MGYIYVAIVCLVAIVAVVAIWAISERAERKAYEKLFDSYKQMYDRCMDNFEAVVDLSDSLNNYNYDLYYDNEELRDAVSDKEQTLLEKEKHIKELEETNERLCKQMHDLFSKGVDKDDKKNL